MGTGDVPTNDREENISQVKLYDDEINHKRNGYIKDSTNKWYNPKDYIDCLYADW